MPNSYLKIIALTTASILLPPIIATAARAQSDDLPLAALRTPDDGMAAHAGHGVEALSAQNACVGGDVCYDLRVGYVEGRIRNPAFPEDAPQGYDNVRLRGYFGEVEDRQGRQAEQIELVAPQVELAPGNIFRMTLHNELPPADEMVLPGTTETCDTEPQDHNTPHCANFNLTNMHTHGLWVTPVGNGDNVLLTINPGVSFTYEYPIPPDHPAGTFWYHSHRHGSTAPQVASGMAGAIIIRGDRPPVLSGDQWVGPGDVDVILPRPVEGEDTDAPSFPERVMLFQQIAYACRDEAGAIKTNEDGTWRCDAAGTDDQGQEVAADIGMLEPGPSDPFDQMTFNSWPASGRHTAINGIVGKTFSGSTVGTVERWRLIHAGVRQTIRLHIRKAADAEEAADALDQSETEVDVAQVCSGEPVEVMGLATDGLTRTALDPRTETWLQPGYREDLLVTFPEAGTYCILNAPVDSADAINALENEPAILGLVKVEAAGSSAEMAAPADPSEHILSQLVASATAVLEGEVADRVVADLQDGMQLVAFNKHPPISADQITGRQTLAFNFAPPDFAIGEIGQDFLGGTGLFPVGAKEYDAGVLDRILPLGGTEEWLLTSFGPAGHPFHIHVNPFEIIEILKYRDPNDPSIDPLIPSTWVDVSGRTEGNTEQYAGLKGSWKDTLFVPPNHVARVRTRYERYIGDFVLHCHILDHEDVGMMQNVRVALPDGKGGFDMPMTEQHAGH